MDAETKSNSKYHIELRISGVGQFDDATKRQIGQYAIDTILNRTEDEQRVDGKSFKGYSKDYVDSDDFKLYGKSKNDVNLELTGRMLDSIDIVDIGFDEIVISFTDATEMAKATNHHYGITVPQRPFFGLNKKEIEAMIREFRREITESERESVSASQLPTLGDLLAGVESVTPFEAPTTLVLSDLLGEFE